MNLSVMNQSYGFGKGAAYNKNRNKNSIGNVNAYSLTINKTRSAEKVSTAEQESALELYKRMRHISTLDLPEAERKGTATEIPDGSIPKKETIDESASRESLEKEAEEEPKEAEEAKSDSDIIVKPDGSRVLVMTMTLGGMKTSMSLQISGPTAMANDCGKGDEASLGLAVELSAEE